MLSLQLVSEIQAGTSLVTPFQPWWEILIDYSLTGILMAVLLGLAGVTFTGTTEIVCIPIVNGSLTTDLSISSYVNSRCSRTFGGSFLLYYPYLALVLYMVLLFGHIVSVKLPSTSSFLELMFQLFADFKVLRDSSAYFGGQAVITNPEEQRMSNETQKGGKLYKVLKVEVKEQVIGLVERLILALQSNPGFFVVYVLKSAILFIGSGLAIAWNLSALFFYDWALVFDCELKMSVAELYESTTCTIPAAPFLYGLMIINAVFSFFILILTCRAIVWLIQSRNFQSKYLQSWKQGKAEHFLSGLAGFRDFTFCLMLMKNNGTDGKDVYETVNSSLQIYKSLKVEQHFENDQLLGTSVASDLQFERDNYICDFMLREMGMQSKEAGESHDLIITLSGLYDYLGINNGDKEEAEKRLRNAIVDEIISHPTRYKDMIDNSKENLLRFFEYVRSIKDGSFLSGEVFECNFVLMAFANCTRRKIVVLRPRLCSFVFTPLCEGDELFKVSYLKHIPPRDYIAVPPLDEPSDEQISNRDRFLESMEYAEMLHENALKLWRSKGYKDYLATLTSLLPKYLTGTENVLDSVDGSPINRPVMSHLTFLEDIGLGGIEDEEYNEDGAKEEAGSVEIN